MGYELDMTSQPLSHEIFIVFQSWSWNMFRFLSVEVFTAGVTSTINGRCSIAMWDSPEGKETQIGGCPPSSWIGHLKNIHESNQSKLVGGDWL